MKEYIGIDIGGTKCAVVLGNERGEIVRKLRFPTQGRDETLKRIFESADELRADRAAAIGVSCGGTIYSRNGVILGPPNLPGWD